MNKMKPHAGRTINWGEQFKIRTRRNASRKHEIIKLLIVLNLMEKYKKSLYWIRIYTEHQIGNKKITDVYFENIKTNEIICYEVQKTVSLKWLEETKKFYNNYEKIYFKTGWTLVREEDLSDEIEILNKEIKELIL